MMKYLYDHEILHMCTYSIMIYIYILFDSLNLQGGIYISLVPID